ncbi:hypothetical protein GIB67_037927 [Kingdonia uniflora]|uniref:Uncharacterized protein n=1 Tax=Kingdonia uniflora TaxID=39325 RepID=A0A7J7LHE5_9MAGN|nr:hypothetical protein GIB67_037927 [Kingdonia uniflora]
MNRVYWCESKRTCWRSVKDRKKFVLMMAREEIINEDMDTASGLLKACGAVGHAGCFKMQADEADLVGHLTPVIRVGGEEDTVAELIEWPHLKGARVEYPTGSSRFREFCKARSSINGIWGHAFGYRGNFFRTCSVSQGGDYLYFLPDLAKEKKCRHLGDEVSLEYVKGTVKDSRTDGFFLLFSPVQLWVDAAFVQFVQECYEYDWGLPDTIELQFLGSYPCIRNPEWEMGFICECLQRSDEEPLELNNRTITKVSRKESLIDAVSREGIELEAVLKEIEISRFKSVASKDEKVKRSQAKRRMAGKIASSMEEKLSTPKLNTPLKLARLNEMPDGPVDMATIFSTVVRNLAKRKAVKRGDAPRSVTSDSVDDSSKRRKVISPTKLQVVLDENDKIAEGANLRPHFEVKAGLLGEQCQAKAREKMGAVIDDEIGRLSWKRGSPSSRGEKNKLEENLTRERETFQLEREKERKAAALKLKEVRAENKDEAERLVTASATSRNNLAGKLYQLRYTKAEIMAFSEGNYEKMEIMDKEEVEEREDGQNVAEKTAVDNQETINQYEDRLDDNVKLSLKLEEAKRQVEEKTAAILSRDLALNQLTSELAELKEKAVSGSRHEAELAEYRIRALNELAEYKYVIV